MSFGRTRGAAVAAPAVGAPTQPLATNGPAHFDIGLPRDHRAARQQVTVTFHQGGITLPACTACIGIAPELTRSVRTQSRRTAWFDIKLEGLVTSIARIPGVHRAIIEARYVCLMIDAHALPSATVARAVAAILTDYFGGYQHVAYQFVWQDELPPLGWTY